MQDFSADVDSSVHAEKIATSEKFSKTLLLPINQYTEVFR